MIFRFLSVLLLAIAVATQPDTCPSPCHDVPPESELPCEFYITLGQCEYDILKDEAGRYAFCFCSCGRCTDGAATRNVPPEPTSVDTISTIVDGDSNAAVASGRAFSVRELVDEVSTAVAEAVADLSDKIQGDEGVDVEAEAVAAAQATTDVVSTAVATAFAATEIRAATSGDESSARGQAEARAVSIANATAVAYASALAEAGDDFVFLEAETMESDVRTALATSYSQLEISGNSQASVANEAVSTAVAEAIAEATASAFARYAQGQAQAIGLATATADISDCPATCNNEPPPDDRGVVEFTCEEQQEWGKCGEDYMVGYCECVCNTCGTGAEAATTTDISLQTDGDQEITAAAGGDAQAEGVGGADASASAIVDAVASGNAQAVLSAVSEAFASGTSAAAFAESIAQAIGDGGETAAVAVAEAFALAENGGYADALAESVVYAFTDAEGNVAQAYGEALSAAIASGGCEAVATVLSEAEALAVGQGAGEAFAEAAAQAEAVNDCLGGTGSASQPAEATAAANAQAVVEAPVDYSQAIADGLAANDVTAAVEAMVIAVRDENSADLATTGLTKGFDAGAVCSTVTQVLNQCIGIVGNNDNLLSAFQQVPRAQTCYQDTVSRRAKCIARTERDCCGSYPEECSCSRILGCRVSQNTGLSVPELGFYVYTDNTFGRDCYCPLAF
eukprot:TRINITY_DN22856_c1_g1_i4.p1 TRINITY_DN22856_c1_g1~~TRINITY_DN22856_c1_g1_i4.p1  ORF type:complete len:683 (-),score=137.19 TRINITY_DN22856_c1_g1_i4:1458-3506(-)